MLSAALLFTGILLAQATSQPVWETSDLGQTTIVPMRSAPYPHASRQEGFKISGKVFPRNPHYVDSSVALFVPKAFKPSERTNVLVYLHGHYNNVRKALADFKIREQIVASGQNLILIFPEGPKDAGDSGCGKLEDKEGLGHLVSEALATLHAEGKIPGETAGRVLLAGHSGAYRGMSFCVEHGGMEKQLRDVALLDSSYGRLEAFVDWAARHPDVHLFSIFTDHLSVQNVFFMTHLGHKKQDFALKIDTDATDEVLTRTRLLFLHTETLKHDETVRWLERWLRSRKLD